MDKIGGTAGAVVFTGRVDPDGVVEESVVVASARGSNADKLLILVPAAARESKKNSGSLPIMVSGNGAGSARNIQCQARLARRASMRCHIAQVGTMSSAASLASRPG